jgi:hypothetical protein
MERLGGGEYHPDYVAARDVEHEILPAETNDPEELNGDLEYPDAEWPRVLMLSPRFATEDSPWVQRRYVAFTADAAAEMAKARNAGPVTGDS